MDDLEKQLRELGERTGAKVTAPTPPASVMRRSRARRLRAATALVSLLAIGAAGAAWAISASSPLLPEDVHRLQRRPRVAADGDVLVAAALATQEQNTARARFDVEIGTGEFDLIGTVGGIGVAEMDFTASRSSLTMQTSGTPTGGGTMEVIHDGSFMYVKNSQGPSDCKWTKQMLSKSPMENMLGLSAGTPASPSQFLDRLSGLTGEVTVVGVEDLDGVQATHYEAELEPDPALNAWMNALFSFEDLNVDFEPVHVWVDDQNLIRRMIFGTTTRYTTDPGTVPNAVEMTMETSTTFTASFFDYGTPVDIDVPDKDELEVSHARVHECLGSGWLESSESFEGSSEN